MANKLNKEDMTQRAKDNEIRKNARQVLKKVPKLRRLSKMDNLGLKSFVFNANKVKASKPNSYDDKLIKRIEAENELIEIMDSLRTLPEMSKNILFSSYCDINPRSNISLSIELGYSSKSVERFKSRALIEFAEAYKSGILLD